MDSYLTSVKKQFKYYKNTRRKDF